MAAAHPLTHLSFQILLALVDAPRHGYGIIKEVEDRFGEAAAPSTGALYLALQRMEGEGAIEPCDAPPDETDVRRKYYRLTAHGRELARSESRRLAQVLAVAQAKDLITGGTG